ARVYAGRLAARWRAVWFGARVARDEPGFGNFAQTEPSHDRRRVAFEQRADRRAGRALVAVIGRRGAVHPHALQPAARQPGLQSRESFALLLAAATSRIQRRTVSAVLSTTLGAAGQPAGRARGDVRTCPAHRK